MSHADICANKDPDHEGKKCQPRFETSKEKQQREQQERTK